MRSYSKFGFKTKISACAPNTFLTVCQSSDRCVFTFQGYKNLDRLFAKIYSVFPSHKWLARVMTLPLRIFKLSDL